MSIALSDKELEAIDEYCKLFKAKSRAAVIREGAVRFVMKDLIDKHTQLFTFDEEEIESLSAERDETEHYGTEVDTKDSAQGERRNGDGQLSLF